MIFPRIVGAGCVFPDLSGQAVAFTNFTCGYEDI